MTALIRLLSTFKQIYAYAADGLLFMYLRTEKVSVPQVCMRVTCTSQYFYPPTCSQRAKYTLVPGIPEPSKLPVESAISAAAADLNTICLRDNQ